MTRDDAQKILEEGKIVERVRVMMGGEPSIPLACIEFLLSELSRTEERVKELEEAIDRHKKILERQMEIGEIDEELYAVRNKIQKKVKDEK